MVDIRKIWEDTYLVNGEYLTQDYNEAVIIANNRKKIKGFTTMESKKGSFWKSLKSKLNFPFVILESWM